MRIYAATFFRVQGIGEGARVANTGQGGAIIEPNLLLSGETRVVAVQWWLRLGETFTITGRGVRHINLHIKDV